VRLREVVGIILATGPASPCLEVEQTFDRYTDDLFLQQLWMPFLV